MHQAGGFGRTIGPLYSPTPQPNPLYWQTPQPGPTYWQAQNQCNASTPATGEKKKFRNLLIQSYWLIWLVFSFIVAYVLGFLILEDP